jgi:hypothetical protein
LGTVGAVSLKHRQIGGFDVQLATKRVIVWNQFVDAVQLCTSDSSSPFFWRLLFPLDKAIRVCRGHYFLAQETVGVQNRVFCAVAISILAGPSG